MFNIENNLSENAVQVELVSTSCKSSAEQLKTHEQLIESLAQQRVCASPRQCQNSCSADCNSTHGTLGEEGSDVAVDSAEDVDHGNGDESGDDDKSSDSNDSEDESEESDDSEDSDNTEDGDDSTDADSLEGDESVESSASTEVDSSSDVTSVDENAPPPRSKHKKMKQNSRLYVNSRRESTRNPLWHSQRSPRSDHQRGPRHKPLSRDLNRTSVVTGNGHHHFRTSSRSSNRTAVGRDSDGFRIPSQHWKKERRMTASLFVFNVPNGYTANDIHDYVTGRSLPQGSLMQLYSHYRYIYNIKGIHQCCPFLSVK